MGTYTGKARVIEPDYSNQSSLEVMLSEMKPGEILIAESTSPELVKVCKIAGAIITNQGGMGSHGAIISREFKIPCIVGTEIASKLVKTGDRIFVNAIKGYIEIINRES